MPVWIKGGTILPILLHNGALSLLRAINNDISLEIYPTATGVAHGQVVIDDGWSTKPEVSRVSFYYSNNDLFVLTKDNSYITNKNIEEVAIFGVEQKPKAVVSQFDLDNKKLLDFTYDANEKSVVISDLGFKLDQKVVGDMQLVLSVVFEE